jgi:hypothetical protein
VEQLGKAFQQIAERQPAEKAEAVSGGQSPANLERFRNVLLVRSGRGLSVVSQKEATNQELNLRQIGGAGGIEPPSESD